MRISATIVFVVCILSYTFVFSQSSPLLHEHFCATDQVAEEHYAEKPELLLRQQQIDDRIYELLRDGDYESGINRMTFVIPVVVHIIHQNGPENISEDKIQNAINLLNQAYQNVDPFNPNEGVSIDIQFCLAVQDEGGNLTNGINRIESELTSYDRDVDDLTLKNLSRWDPTKYLNIWVVKEINSSSAGSGVAGYATFPASHGEPYDGIVVEFPFFGASPLTNRVVIHEAGHYLGVYHTFQGGCFNGDCLANGDRVCDTPPDASTAIVGCQEMLNSCTTDEDDISLNNPFRPVAQGGLGDQPDMINNYMDYGFFGCWNAFTQGQSDRMILSIMGPRASLLNSLGCVDPCTGTPIEASFTASSVSINVNETVDFTNTTTGATDYEWQIDDVAFSSDIDASYTFNEIGNYEINLVASNDEPNCTDQFAVDIEVTCPVSASFIASATDIQPGETIDFDNTSTGGITYEWFIDGALVSTDEDFSNTFNDVGGFLVYLVASDGTCADTSDTQFISVGFCKAANKRANIWYFGIHAGVDFNGPDLTALIDGQINQQEGCATICDESGGLLFYTEGQNVWNKNHQLMPNGTGLLGHQSSTQSAIIVPRPGFPERYYIFTVGTPGSAGGFRYSEIDMSLEGGLGDVITATKNELLFEQVTEKVTAVSHANGKDIWVITHGWESDVFYAYLITENGLILPAIESQVGSSHGGGFANLGYLKASPLGNRLALAIGGTNGKGEVFDFDPGTGLVTNPITLEEVENAYGVEFSPNGNRVYYTVNYSRIDQYDLLAGDEQAILNSRTSIGFTINSSALQLGPDGKIYSSRTFMEHLGVINNPNTLGLDANFVDEGFYLDGGVCQGGLPNLIQSYFRQGLILGPPQVCLEEEEVVYSVAEDDCISEVIWTYNGAGVIDARGNSIGIVFSEAGTDTLIVQLRGSCCFLKDTLIVEIGASPEVDLGPDTALCSGVAISLNAGPGFERYEWQDGSSVQTFEASTPGEYWVVVENAAGCEAADTVKVHPVAAEGVLDLGNDTTVCEGVVLTLDAGEGFETYIWSNGAREQILSPEFPGVYSVAVTDLCGNTARDTLTITWEAVELTFFEQELISCDGSSVLLNASSGYVGYLWQDSTQGPMFLANTSGTYWVSATDSTGCVGADTVVVLIAEELIAVSLGQDNELCEDSTLILEPLGGPFASYLWQDGSATSFYVAQSAGEYSVTVTDDMGCEAFDVVFLSKREDCLDYTLQIPNVFTPNGDGSNQNFVIPGIEKADWSLTIYNRWGNEVYFNVNYQNNWDGGELSDGVYYYVLEAPLLQRSHSGYVHLLR